MGEQEQTRQFGYRRRALGVFAAGAGVGGTCIAVYGLAAHDAGARTYGGVLAMMCVTLVVCILNPPRD